MSKEINFHNNLETRKQLFTKKAFTKFGKQFEYLGNFVNFKTPIEVTCQDHGSFVVRPQDHIKNKYGSCAGCNLQGRFNIALEHSRKVHGSWFQYGDDFKTVNDPITIICPVHGPFKNSMVSHYTSNSTFSGGCPECKRWLSWSLEEVDKFCGDSYKKDGRDPTANTVFRPAPGKPAFSVSSCGGMVYNRVKAAKRGFNKYLKPSLNNSGYHSVRVGTEPEGIHRLVLRTFKPIEDIELYHAHHIDGDPQHNDLINLEWVKIDEHYTMHRQE